MITDILSSVNDVLYSRLLIFLLLGCALWFTLRSRCAQFRLLGEMLRLLFRSGGKRGGAGERQVSSFQAFAVSLASRVGTGNLAGVATAVAVGGPGAVFWMWVTSLLGASSALVECTLAQKYRQRGEDSYVGGPAYYMQYGLGRRWMGVLFAILITLTFGFAFNSVQSNTICAAWHTAFGFDTLLLGLGLAAFTLVVIFGGIRRVAHVCSMVVPFMALGYLALALTVVAMHADRIPHVLHTIFSSAFGWQQAAGGGMGVAMINGIRRGLFSNEAGMGSAPNVAATANVEHPVMQGLLQAFGVFTDTLIICSCTAFIILVSDVSLQGHQGGVQLTQEALCSVVGPIGGIFVALAILLFAFSSIVGNYFYGETNLRFITPRRSVLFCYRLLVGAMVLFGALTSLELVWSLADVTMGLMTILNLIAITALSPQAFDLIADYCRHKGK